MATYNGNNINSIQDLANGDIINYEYSGSVKTISLPKGVYKLEVWGAEGAGRQSSGNSSSGLGGKGGYSKGTITFSKNENLTVVVGGTGGSSTSNASIAGFNGGGVASASSSSEPSNSGGGATDIRISKNSLYARVIVAGGGGGGGEDSSDSVGYAGGLESGNRSPYNATQTGTGQGGVFGLGANTPNDGGGGGGGWFGGGTVSGTQSPITSNSTGDAQGGAGGSGYVLTSTSYKPSGYLLGVEYYLADTSLLAGNISFTSPQGSNEMGHSGNGYARITVIETQSTFPVYQKSNGEWQIIEENAVAMYQKTSGVWNKIS